MSAFLCSHDIRATTRRSSTLDDDRTLASRLTRKFERMHALSASFSTGQAQRAATELKSWRETTTAIAAARLPIDFEGCRMRGPESALGMPVCWSRFSSGLTGMGLW
ncbi:hypothetical protein [Microbacterium sp. LEMMJ01]|uniref:hypothetical protein n=1 Tax=Microbacterium sp. LEMMJ01 TaxID=1978350 RepID=UPI00111C763B|nr:hypothetical protein [Microbacterium sp. LEMMJ01]